jgi:pseudouridine-5'-phosphate glycosidase
MTLPLILSPEVTEARASGAAIVALESTIITHGMPFPQNVETARRVEAEVRAHGAVPATIVIKDRHIHVGLTDAELDGLGRAQNVAKLSRADLAACLASGGTGATTVAATMICAHLAGIGSSPPAASAACIAGRNTSFDISADLRELAETPVTVVAPGPRRSSTCRRRWRYLETLGVPVIALRPG